MNAPDPVRFGILGAGRIATHAFAPALAAAANAELHAVASRDRSRAESLGPRRAYDRYEALLDDPDVEAVYIATHNGLHCPLALRAFERGKHVLCEKPLACNARECAEMLAAARANRRLLVEAFMYRYHPQVAAAQELIVAGRIGRLRVVEAAFSFCPIDEGDVRMNPAWGGGSLLDVGSYCVNACRLFFGGLPIAVKAFARRHPLHGVDLGVHGVLEFPNERFGLISCGFDAAARNRVSLIGTEGAITLPAAFANNRQPVSLIVEIRAGREQLDFPATDVFQLEIEDFARAVRDAAPPLLPPDEGLHDARVMDALLASAGDGATTTPVPAE